MITAVCCRGGCSPFDVRVGQGGSQRRKDGPHAVHAHAQGRPGEPPRRAGRRVGRSAAADDELVGAMLRYHEELVAAGVYVSAEGLLPSATGKRVAYKRGRRKVIDGPFTEAKELVAGYYIIDVPSMDEAVEWASKLPGRVRLRRRHGGGRRDPADRDPGRGRRDLGGEPRGRTSAPEQTRRPVGLGRRGCRGLPPARRSGPGPPAVRARAYAKRHERHGVSPHRGRIETSERPMPRRVARLRAAGRVQPAGHPGGPDQVAHVRRDADRRRHQHAPALGAGPPEQGAQDVEAVGRRERQPAARRARRR